MISAIILASGSGMRFQNQQPKQFIKLAGMPVLAHTLKVFQTCAVVDEIVVVCHHDYVEQVWEMAAQYSFGKVARVVTGGQTRQQSSFIGLKACSDNSDSVLIHDSVRPFLSHAVITELVMAVKKHGAVDTVIPSADTLVEVDADGFISNIPDRARFRRGQTPQAFARELILRAHREALADGIDNATDDCQLVIRIGHRVFCVEGHEQNIKITYPIDLHIADKLFQLNCQSPPAGDDSLRSFFTNKVAVIIGGSAGIGASLAALLRSWQSTVVSGGRNSHPAVDVTDAVSVRQFIDAAVSAHGRIDFVINCAGDLIRRDIEFMTASQWRDIYRVNVEGCFNVAQAVIPHFRRQQSGSLLFVGSSSYTRGRGGYAAYSSSKAAVVNFCQALAEELAPVGARVNVASPGRVKTGLRVRNFGLEPEGSLLCPDHVARQMAAALVTETTGSVFDIT